MKKTIFSVFLITFFIGCTNHDIQKNKFEIIQPNFKPLGLGKDDLMNPKAILLFDSILLVADQYNNKGISVINLNKKQLIKRIISIGRGANEVLSSSPITKVSKKTFEIRDPNLKKVLFFSIDSINTHPVAPINIIYYKDIPLKEHETIFRLYQIKDSLYTALGAFNDSQHLIIKKNSKSPDKFEISYKYDYPLIDQKEYKHASNFSKCSIFSGYISISPDNKHMGYSSYNCFYYKTFDIVNNTIEKTYERIDYLPEYRITPSGYAAFSIESKQGFQSPYATNEALYLLHLTRNIEDYGTYHVFTRELYRIGWDGKIKQKFILNRDTRHIAVDEKNKRIYATCLNYETTYVELGYYDF